jgi:hypothetical protein
MLRVNHDKNVSFLHNNIFCRLYDQEALKRIQNQCVHHILIITEKYIIFVFTKVSKLKYCKQQKEQKAITIIIGCTASKPNISRMHVHQVKACIFDPSFLSSHAVS